MSSGYIRLRGSIWQLLGMGFLLRLFLLLVVSMLSYAFGSGTFNLIVERLSVVFGLGWAPAGSYDAIGFLGTAIATMVLAYLGGAFAMAGLSGSLTEVLALKRASVAWQYGAAFGVGVLMALVGYQLEHLQKAVGLTEWLDMQFPSIAQGDILANRLMETAIQQQPFWGLVYLGLIAPVCTAFFYQGWMTTIVSATRWRPVWIALFTGVMAMVGQLQIGSAISLTVAFACFTFVRIYSQSIWVVIVAYLGTFWLELLVSLVDGPVGIVLSALMLERSWLVLLCSVALLSLLLWRLGKQAEATNDRG